MSETDHIREEQSEQPATEATAAGALTAQSSAWRLWKHRLALTIILLLGGGGLFSLMWQAITWPDVEALAQHDPETTAFIDRYRERHEGRVPKWNWVSYLRISPHLKRAVIVAEDINFFSHRGFALDELKVALQDALSGRRELRGASTITQQLAKNLWLSPSRDPLRKAKEFILTRQLERKLSKPRILELYLNVVEFGPGIYGAEAAARHYFSASAAALDEAQSAQLAASLPRPSRWHPGSESDSYRRYVSDIRDRMERAQFLWRRIGPDQKPSRGPAATPAAGAVLAPGASATGTDSLIQLAADTGAAGAATDAVSDPAAATSRDSAWAAQDSLVARSDTVPPR